MLLGRGFLELLIWFVNKKSPGAKRAGAWIGGLEARLVTAHRRSPKTIGRYVIHRASVLFAAQTRAHDPLGDRIHSAIADYFRGRVLLLLFCSSLCRHQSNYLITL